MGSIAMDTPQPRLLNRCGIRLIRYYQRFISPHKGYCCAHHQLHQQGSCSAFGIQCLTHQSVPRALGMMRRRSQSCHAAAKELQKPGKSHKRSGQLCNILLLFCPSAN